MPAVIAAAAELRARRRLATLLVIATAFAAFSPAPLAGAQEPAPVAPLPTPQVSPLPAGPDAASIVSTPSRRTLYKGGPSGRFLVDGTWLFRGDPAGNGDLLGWQRSP